MSTDDRQSIEHFDLSGRKALVIGADNPAGSAIARAYGEAGADVALAVLRPDESVLVARKVQREIEAMGGRSSVYVMDVTLGKNVQVTTRQIVKEMGGLDVLVSAADLFLGKPIRKTTDVELLQVMTVNFFGQYYAVRSASAEMMKNHDGEGGGNIVLLTHVLGERGVQHSSAYSAAHGALQNFVRAVAQELAPHHISVNAIELGWMEWMHDRLDPDDEDAGRAVRFTIMKRAGTAEEVGPIAVWLAGTGAGYVTGQTFAVDGGLTQHL